MADPGFLLQFTDETVALVQKLVTDFHADIEQHGKKSTNYNSQLGAHNRDAVELTSHLLNEGLAKLWPCEQKYVAVIGPTGCGKSTLLNSIIAMTCRTGKSYTEGILHGPERAALRETARQHNRNFDDVNDADIELTSDNQSNPDSAPVVSEGLGNQGLNPVIQVDVVAERTAICGLLGICCARKREAYFSQHLADQDKNPFLLLNGRMGDAGTTKVTAVQWGPQFACHFRWMEKKKLRKRCRELRKSINDPNSSQIEQSRISEYKEVWKRMLSIVDHRFDPMNVPTPADELLESTLRKLSKIVPLGRTETMQTGTTKGAVLDRLHVRGGIQIRLIQQRLALLTDELIIEAPIPSSEGGVSLLDVPGTNDPRVLHQRETRDAIDRTALILLIVDKSVLDKATVKVLEDSPILERMLLDDPANCSLVVVGIAEKGRHLNQSACDIIAKFDPNENLMKVMKGIFLRTVKRLSTSRRLDMRVGKQRVDRIFQGHQFSVLPVLPLLCASLHLSRSNGELHKEFCESSGLPTCPMMMSEEELMERCLETNMPQLLEKILGVRMPPTLEDLQSLLASTTDMLENLTQVPKYDLSTVEFLRRELKHAKTKSSEVFRIEKLLPEEAVDLLRIHEVMRASAEKCQMSSEDIERVNSMLGKKSAVRAVNNTTIFQLAPIIMHGFRPELIGKMAQKLIQPTEEKAAAFVNGIYKHMETSLQGVVSWRETTLEKVSFESLGACTALIAEGEKGWKRHLDRIRARWLCGGPKGGLLKEVRDALRKSYDKSMKYILQQLRMHSNDATVKERSLQLLNQNVAGNKLQELAQKEIEIILNKFWDSATELFQSEPSKMWKSWQDQLVLLKRNTEKDLNKENVAEEGIENVANVEQGEAVIQKLQENITALKSLQQRLVMHSISGGKVNYGYSLLQRNPSFEDLNLKRNKRAVFISELKVDTTPDLQQEILQGQSSAGDPDPGPGRSSWQRSDDRPYSQSPQSASRDSNQLVESPTQQGWSPRPSTPSSRLAPLQPRRAVIPLSDEQIQVLHHRDSVSKKTPKRKRP